MTTFAARRVAVLVIMLNVLRVAESQGQSRGRDLPEGFRSLGGVTLNRDSAVSIRARLGPSRERRLGRESGYDQYVSWCYVRTGGSPGPLLELMSDASVMGTPGQELNVIRLRQDVLPDERRGCAPLRPSTRLSTPAGLRLGLDRADIETRLGPPTRARADSLIWTFDAKEFLRPGTPAYQTWNTPESRESCFDAGAPYANVESRVVILLHDGRAVEIRLERFDQSVC